jgi:hypothetical protein
MMLKTLVIQIFTRVFLYLVQNVVQKIAI